jgi:translation initiation factor 6
MATRCQYESSNEIGNFSALTNAYALAAIGGSENFYSVLGELNSMFPHFSSTMGLELFF